MIKITAETGGKSPRYVFATADRQMVVVTDMDSIVEAGAPVDPESGQDLEYLGPLHPDCDVPCGEYHGGGFQMSEKPASQPAAPADLRPLRYDERVKADPLCWPTNARDIVTEIPTYNGNLDGYEAKGLAEYGEPVVPVRLAHSEGLRVVLGSRDSDPDDAPSIIIERQHNKWLVFASSQEGGDAELLVYITDDRHDSCRKIVVVPESTPPADHLIYSDTVPD